MASGAIINCEILLKVAETSFGNGAGEKDEKNRPKERLNDELQVVRNLLECAWAC